MRSLADDCGESAVGIVLSGTGTGSDGTQGLRVICGACGLCLAQDPATARFDGEPQSAIHGGHAMLALPPDLAGAALLSVDRASLVGTPLEQYLPRADQPRWRPRTMRCASRSARTASSPGPCRPTTRSRRCCPGSTRADRRRHPKARVLRGWKFRSRHIAAVQ